MRTKRRSFEKRLFNAEMVTAHDVKCSWRCHYIFCLLDESCEEGSGISLLRDVTHYVRHTHVSHELRSFCSRRCVPYMRHICMYRATTNGKQLWHKKRVLYLLAEGWGQVPLLLEYPPLAQARPEVPQPGLASSALVLHKNNIDNLQNLSAIRMWVCRIMSPVMDTKYTISSR